MTAPAIFLLVSATLCVALALYGCSQRRDAFTMYFIGLMAASAVYACGYALELSAVDLERMKSMLRIEYLGIPFLSVTWLGMAWSYLNPTGLRRRVLFLLLTPCVATFLAFQTNDAHHLFYASLDLVRQDGLSVAVAQKGPLYWLHIAYLNLCIAAGILLFIRAWRQSIRIYRSQALCILLGSFFPWGFHLFYLAGLSPHGLDLGPFGLAASGMLFAVASFQHRIFDILPVARDLVFDGISEGVIVLSGRNHISDFNRSASRYVKGLSAESIGKPLDDISGGSAIAKILSSLEATSASEDGPSAEMDLIQGQEHRTFEIRLSAMADRAGVIQCKALVLLDVTEKRMLLEQLRREAQTDPLTGLLNRRQFETEAKRLIALAKRRNTPLTIAAIDIDHFKAINDTRGHSAGDSVLQTLSSLLHNRLRSTDIVSRVGGDEFVVLLPGTQLAEGVSLMECIKAAFFSAQATTLSIGLVELSSDHDDVENLLAEADQRLYEAKRNGRNQVSFMMYKMKPEILGVD